jgi:DNA-binding protein H-NS
MSEFDLAGLTPEQLSTLSAQAANLAKEKQNSTEADAVKRLNAIAAEAGLSIRIFVEKSGKKSLPVSHRHPSDPTKVWKGGYGTPPAWLKELVAQGHSMDEFRVS